MGFNDRYNNTTKGLKKNRSMVELETKLEDKLRVL
jgi:hypothetical protein